MQAVGNTPDGTMVVVDKASKKIGETVEIEVVRSLQTQAGKMVFGKLVAQKNNNNTNTKVKTNKSKNTKLNKPKTQEDKIIDLINSPR